MKLLTKEIRKKLPALREQEGKGGDAVVKAKFFTPDSSWTWYVLEGEPVYENDQSGVEIDFEFFGIADNGVDRPEYGAFTLNQLKPVRGHFGLPIERDRYFGTPTVRDLIESGKLDMAWVLKADQEENDSLNEEASRKVGVA